MQFSSRRSRPHPQPPADTQEHGSYRKANLMHIGPSKPQPLQIAAQPIGRRRATTQRISCKQHRRSSVLARPSLHLPESSPSMPIPARVPSRVLASMCRRRMSHLASVAGATHAQLPSSNEAASRSDHRCSRSRGVSGKRGSHVAPSGTLRQAVASRRGIANATASILGSSSI